MVGDLSSILKVEKRRWQTLESVKEFQGRETAFLIDRYRFLDLFPCTDSELRALGYRVSRSYSNFAIITEYIYFLAELLRHHLAGFANSRGFLDDTIGINAGCESISLAAGEPGASCDDMLVTVSGATGTGGIVGNVTSGGASGGVTSSVASLAGGLGDFMLTGDGHLHHHHHRPAYPQPDVNHMLPFKPKAYPRIGSHPVAGGEFPPPPTASHLLHLLPPPQCFMGPFVDIDRFLEHFINLDLPKG
ncbi:unnamed protein product [Protopolystoma xenopodis]|uniref:Uncharacterized protein n=1 Tax=Protopolystoma xenopodis TaxID=117903 RepID=A0A448WHF8_9PLAT|nr:unnamed protein product [Protopolystoma xenopodis]